MTKGSRTNTKTIRHELTRITRGIAVGGLLTLLLSGCTDSAPELKEILHGSGSETPEVVDTTYYPYVTYSEAHIRLGDGTIVTCISADRGSMSCDWVGADRPAKKGK